MLPVLTEAAAAARERLTQDVWDYYDGGAGDETAALEGAEAWRRYRLRPRALRPVGDIDLRTSVLGTAVRTPVLVAPTALHGLAHADAERATATGVRAAGSLLVLSTRSSLPPEHVVGTEPWWCQLYVLRDHGLTNALIQRAVEHGARALVLTVDTPVLGAKRRGGLDVRSRELLRSLEPLFPGHQLPDDVGDGIEQDPDLGPDVIAELVQVGGVPVVVKGVLRADDARLFVDAGASAVYVSNHGGRQLDRAIPTAQALPEVVEAVAGRAEVYTDGGIRSGTDALTALALGARAVFVGRPVLWGLAADGAEGVRAVLAALTGDLRRACALAGSASLAELRPDLVVPAD